MKILEVLEPEICHKVVEVSESWLEEQLPLEINDKKSAIKWLKEIREHEPYLLSSHKIEREHLRPVGMVDINLVESTNPIKLKTVEAILNKDNTYWISSKDLPVG
jgi:hypothetical protein